MRKSVFFKGIFSFVLAITLISGLLQLTAEPAEAGFQCPATFRGNTFSHIEYSGYICCCIYLTPSGQQVVGPSWYC